MSQAITALGTEHGQSSKSAAGLQLPKGPGSEKSKEIDALIEGLDHDDWKKREQSSERLLALGDVAIPALRRACRESTSDEVRFRCGEILLRIEKKRSNEFLKAVNEIPLGGEFEGDAKLQGQLNDLTARASLFPLRAALAGMRRDPSQNVPHSPEQDAHVEKGFAWLSAKYCGAVTASYFSPLKELQQRGREEVLWIRDHRHITGTTDREELVPAFGQAVIEMILNLRNGKPTLGTRFEAAAAGSAVDVLNSNRPDAVERVESFLHDYFGDKSTTARIEFTMKLCEALPQNKNAGELLLRTLEDQAQRAANGDADASARLTAIARQHSTLYAGAVARSTKPELKPIFDEAKRAVKE